MASDKNVSLSGVSAIKLALLAQKARAENEAVLRADPIAIVGMGCRFPGADNPDAYWNLLRDGVDAVSEVPADRWDNDALYDPDPSVPGKSMTKSGGFLPQIDRFDADFFGIMRREAERMDPQQRLFLEVATEALDHAGLPRERLAGSRTGVFIASYHSDYAALLHQDLEKIDARTLTGSVHSVLANRLSYLLDLRGPSISIDTACSSSLVAVHVACQSLRYGESDVALAGGVSLMITPDLMVSLSKVGFMAPDGRSKTFDASADGFGRAEGCGVVVLKRLSDAVRDGDRVLALVRGSAVNQDGHSTVISAPNGLAQQTLIREALSNAQLEPGRIGFVEAHGTGTALGDPIEVEAIAATVGRRDVSAEPCFIGAAKANLGHMEAAAGVGGLIKGVLVLQNDAIPPQVHFKSPNPHLTLSGTRLAIPTALTPWPGGAAPRCIGTSGFGVGGTNAHVIIEEAPKLPPMEDGSRPTLQVLPLSARSEVALRELAQSWLEFLSETGHASSALCATAAQRRSHYDVRLAVAGASAEALQSQLRAAIDGMDAATPQRRAERPTIAFAFCGQGAQWAGMGRELLAGEPVFREIVAQIDSALRVWSGWSLIDELEVPEERSRLQETEVAQPAIFAIQVGLSALWKSWGVAPDAVTGHSIGEIAALHVAGVLSLEDAVRVVWHRAKAMQAATGLGVMASVALSEQQAAQEIKPYGADLSVAAVNAPRSVVLSGRKGALDVVLARLAARNVTCRPLHVNYAFHSAQMIPFAEQLSSALAGITLNAPRIPVYSTVTGARLETADMDAGYFGRNIRQPVRFADAAAALMRDGYSAVVEIGPHPVLSASVAEIESEQGIEVIKAASLRRGRPERETMLQALARLYTAGVNPDWEAAQGGPADVIDLPAYPWQRQRYWIETGPRKATIDSVSSNANHVLGARISSPAGDIFQSVWPNAAPAWLADHIVGGRIVMPGAAMLDALMRAGRDALGHDGVKLSDFVIHHPLVIDEGTTWQVTRTQPVDGSCEVTLHERMQGASDSRQAWRLIASATVSEGVIAAQAVAAVDTPSVGLDYDAFAQLGVAFGDAFKTVVSLSAGPHRAVAVLKPVASATHDAVHPTLIDGAWQACVSAAEAGKSPSELRLPVGVDAYSIIQPVSGPMHAHVSWQKDTSGTLTANIVFLSDAGEPVAIMQGVRFAPASSQALASLGASPDDLYETAWEAAPPSSGRTRGSGAWVVLVDEWGVGDALCQALIANGHHVRALRGSGGSQSRAINPADPSQFSTVFSDADWREGLPLNGVVNLWPLDEPDFATDGVAADSLAYGSGLHLVQAGLAARSSATLWMVTRGAQPVADDVRKPTSASLWGLMAAVAEEHPELNCRLLDLDPDSPASTSAIIDELAAESDSRRLAHRNGGRFVPVLRPLQIAKRQAGPVRLHLDGSGSVDNLALRSGGALTPGAGEVRIGVHAAGLNFRDVLFALGMYPSEKVALGAECAGVVEAVGASADGVRVGQSVFGFVSNSLASTAVSAAEFVAPVPRNLTLAQAAGQPAAYLTAMFGLERVADLKPGQRVLIHAGAGGVGMAAMNIARGRGAQIFATAGSPAKRALLKKMGAVLALDSRSLTFAGEIMAATDGKGVDVVLNSLSGDFIGASIGVVAKGGCFLELGKRGIWPAKQVAETRPDIRYRVYDLGEELAADHGLARAMMQDLAARLESSDLDPLPIRAFRHDKVRDAFRMMSQGRHTGKLVVEIPQPDTAKSIVRRDGTYLVTGGLGALGLKTARWLAASGAGRIVLVGRHAPNERALADIAACQALGAVVEVVAADVGDQEAMAGVLAGIPASERPLRGVVHAAGVLDDGVVAQQTLARFGKVRRGKASGAHILHKLTAGLPLDFFIMYSAAGLVLGPAGQAPYAAANAELDAVAHARRSVGLPALSVAWGLWRDGGMAQAGDARGEKAWAARGLGEIVESRAFAEMEQLVRENVSYAAVLPIDWNKFLSSRADPDGFFKPVKRNGGSAPSRAVKRIVDDWRVLPESERGAAVLAAVRQHAITVIGLDDLSLLSTTALKDAGLDSLMAVELRNAISRSIGEPLPATLLFDYPTLNDLSAFLLRKLKLLSDRQPDPDHSSTGSSVAAAVASLTDAEAEAELLAELNGGAS